jgi:hypothetical protein
VVFARSATLYRILAAEAYANDYLESNLSNKDFTAVDRLPTLDKYLLGPRLVHGQDLFTRGKEPAQTLRTLLDLRTRLVHPKLFESRSEALAMIRLTSTSSIRSRQRVIS